MIRLSSYYINAGEHLTWLHVNHPVSIFNSPPLGYEKIVIVPLSVATDAGIVE